MTTINNSIDDALAQSFSENCSKKGITAQDAIIDFIKKSGRKFRFSSLFKKTSLDEGRNAFYLLRGNAQQSGKSFSDSDIENIINEVRSARMKTDARLVTGNFRHFPEKPFVVSAREMTEIVEKE